MRRVLALCTAVAVLGLQPSAAYEVSPMVYDLEPSGPRASTLIRIVNTEDRPITLEILAFERLIAEDGTETRRPADDDFNIFPLQTIVQPGKTQAVRVQYAGEPVTDTGKIYLVQVTQVPVRHPNEGTGVQMVVNFGTAVYVAPSGAKPNLKVASVEAGREPGTVSATLENHGSKHVRLAKTIWTVSNATGQSFTLTGEPLAAALLLPVVPSRGRRTFQMKVPESFDATGPLKLSIADAGS